MYVCVCIDVCVYIYIYVYVYIYIYIHTGLQQHLGKLSLSLSFTDIVTSMHVTSIGICICLDIKLLVFVISC